MVLLLAAIAYFVLTRSLINCHGKNSTLAAVLGCDRQGKISIIIHALAVLLCFMSPVLACLMYVLTAAIWLVPDRRIEKSLLS